ncbi:putative electron transport oxidoreductase [Fusarium austroafricanum]|uniref:Putative electron transport oxidoreductase n=1 Tax=Fusarium austroafricanum TaxID=2364996 RepID=A0A8H4JR04_9HYPO|nr:putative electron transport oxidoreductase [Fusarium austroafricanum]
MSSPFIALPAQLTDDHALQQVLKYPGVLDRYAEDLQRLSCDVISQEILGSLADAERNPPSVIKWDTWGRHVNQLVTSDGWKRLREFEVSRMGLGIASDKALGYNGRVMQFAKYHLWAGSSGSSTVHTGLSDGASRILYKQLLRPDLSPELRSIFIGAIQRLCSNDPASIWTSGIWMTETTGGSDVSGIQTTATYVPAVSNGVTETSQMGEELGPWCLNGFKCFTSGVEASIAIVLAKTSKGLSAFCVPTRIESTGHDGVTTQKLNGIEIVRLKSKMGTKTMATAELRLINTRGHLLGEEGEGLKIMLESLNIARIYCALAALGLWGRGLAISRSFSKTRKVTGGLNLDQVPLFVRGLSKLHVSYRASMHFLFFVVSMLGQVEQPTSPTSFSAAATPIMPKSVKETQFLLRLFTSVLKATTAKDSIGALQNCMESLGGIGYLENDEMEVNIARLFRDANVLSIWEGTTDVLATDAVKTLKAKSSVFLLAALNNWLEQSLASIEHFESEKSIVVDASVRLQQKILDTPMAALLVEAREVLNDLQGIICAVLLMTSCGKDDQVGHEVVKRWLASKLGHYMKGSGQEAFDVSLDHAIVYGEKTAA